MNNKKLFVLLGALVLVIGGAWLLMKPDALKTDVSPELVEMKNDPLDVTSEFYNAWMMTVTSGSSTESLLVDDHLTSSLQEQLVTTYDEADPAGLKSVLCKTVVPPRVGPKIVYEKSDQVQHMVIARGIDDAGQAVVTLVPDSEYWKIDSIQCVFGEQPPPAGEFAFEQSGQLLQGVEALPDTEHWYLVYAVAGTGGYTAKLMFTTTSTCVSTDGTESVCASDTFAQAAAVRVQGDISEEGVTVQRMIEL